MCFSATNESLIADPANVPVNVISGGKAGLENVKLQDFSLTEPACRDLKSRMEISDGNYDEYFFFSIKRTEIPTVCLLMYDFVHLSLF